jgi:hypothetical protein
MAFSRSFRVLVWLPAFFCSAPVSGAGAPCVNSATIEKATLGLASAKHYYMECAVVADGKHPFLARLTAERRAAATERLKDKTAQTLACSANPRDPVRSGLAKREMVVLASCKPARVGEVWPLQ